MKKFMVRFEGLKLGYVGKSDIYTLTVSAATPQEALTILRTTHRVNKVLLQREVKSSAA